MKNSYKRKLLTDEIRVGIWGSGYIGFTSAINFAIKGVSVICYDINEFVVNSVNNCKIIIPNLEKWIDFNIKELVKNKLLIATNNIKDMMQDAIKVHLIAIPTEKNGEPYSDALKDVIGKICKRNSRAKFPDLIIIESTLSTKNVDNVLNILRENNKELGKDIIFGVAPRRDWFHSKEKNLKNLPRVYAGYDKSTSEIMREILSIICDNLIQASSVEIAALVKSVENSLLHIPVVYAMQLALSYPDIDITEVLKLAATHWRIPYYYPSLATGGYCIPVAGKYVKDGAIYPEKLTLIDEALKYDGEILRLIVDKIIVKRDVKVGILGITYKGDLKVHTLSPSLKILHFLKEKDMHVEVSDPYYSKDELQKLTGVKVFEFSEDLKKFDIIIMVPSHKVYQRITKKILFKYIRKGQKIYDNTGAWGKFKKDFERQGIEYFSIGKRGWAS